MESRNPNSSPYASVASTFLTKPLGVFFFLYFKTTIKDETKQTNKKESSLHFKAATCELIVSAEKT